MRVISSVDRALVSGIKGRGFESLITHISFSQMFPLKNQDPVIDVCFFRAVAFACQVKETCLLR